MSIHLTPELEALLHSQAQARGIQPDSLIADALEAYLGPTSARDRLPGTPRAAEMAWAANPDPRYFGQWVVLNGNRVVASGSDPKRLYDDARASGLTSPFLIFVSPEENEPFAGGWID